MNPPNKHKLMSRRTLCTRVLLPIVSMSLRMSCFPQKKSTLLYRKMINTHLQESSSPPPQGIARPPLPSTTTARSRALAAGRPFPSTTAPQKTRLLEPATQKARLHSPAYRRRPAAVSRRRRSSSWACRGQGGCHAPADRRRRRRRRWASRMCCPRAGQVGSRPHAARRPCRGRSMPRRLRCPRAAKHRRRAPDRGEKQQNRTEN